MPSGGWGEFIDAGPHSRSTSAAPNSAGNRSRMLTPRELYRAQSFPDAYVIDRGIDEHGAEIAMTEDGTDPDMRKFGVSVGGRGVGARQRCGPA